MTWLLRIPRALAVLAGWDDGAKLEHALTIERDNLLAQLAQCRTGRQEEAGRHERVRAELSRQLEELRVYLRQAALADPAGVLDRLLSDGGGTAGAPAPSPVPPKPAPR